MWGVDWKKAVEKLNKDMKTSHLKTKSLLICSKIHILLYNCGRKFTDDMT